MLLPALPAPTHSIELLKLFQSAGTSHTGEDAGPTHVQMTEPSTVVAPVTVLNDGMLPPEIPGVVTCCRYRAELDDI